MGMSPRRVWVAALVAVTLAASAAAAQPDGYTRSRGVTITETSGATLTDFQVRLVLDTASLIAAGELRLDDADLIFTSADCDAIVLPHWIERGVNSAETIVWVKVPRLAGGETTRLILWHGNPAATSTSSARAVFIGTGPNNDPISGTGVVTGGMVSQVGNSQRGFGFRPNLPILVAELGKQEPNGTTRTITLFDVATQQLVHQQQVAGGANVYAYGAIARPFWLEANHEYTLQLFQNASESYSYVASSQVSPDLTYVNLRYCNSCTASTFPTLTLSSYHYGYPDLRYYKRQAATSEPTFTFGPVACTESATCDADCSEARCGDGLRNLAANEACDDGNQDDTDDCRNTCAPASCGDGVVRAGGSEQCDDGNQDDTDACRTTCLAARCGDGVVEVGVEACDDGNPFSDDGCRPDCTEVLVADGCCSSGGTPRELVVTALLALLVVLRLGRGSSRRSPARPRGPRPG